VPAKGAKAIGELVATSSNVEMTTAPRRRIQAGVAAKRAKAIAKPIAAESVCGRTGSVSAAGESRVHAAGEMAGDHVSATAAARSAESASVAAAALGAKGHSEEKGERRKGGQGAHTQLL
jgi:hypothetical protein